jgi:hypothetical protein
MAPPSAAQSKSTLEANSLSPHEENNAVELLFHRVYEMAEMMAGMVTADCDYCFGELDWDSSCVHRCLVAFSKSSLLGYFCFAHIAIHERSRFRRDPELVDVETEHLAFLRYAIPHIRFEEFRQSFPGVEDGQDAFYPWMLDQEEAFARLWERMTDEVVHILFGNRGFLLEFNLGLAEYRKRRRHRPSTRCAIPQWVKKAVYFRENGKCAICKKDLSGLIALDTKQHYDHIVPLKSLGANDPCNIQLLCEKCNLLKGASPARTSFIYDPWWK